MMTRTTAFLFGLAAVADAFVVVPRRSFKTRIFVEKEADAKSDYAAHVHQEWAEKEAHMQEFEHSLLTDADLDNVVEHKRDINKEFMGKEAHKHDTLLNEIEHSIDTDPDLTEIAHDIKVSVKKDYIDKEAHKHDSLLDEIEHSIDMDPDLPH